MCSRGASVTLNELAQLGPAATAVAAIIAFAIGLATIVQRGRSDRRDQWWKRAQWALDLTLDEDPNRRAVGFAALEVLAESELARKEEIRLLEVAWLPELDSAEDALEHDELVEGAERDENGVGGDHGRA